MVFLAAASEQANVRAAFADYEKYTCLKFVEAVVGDEQYKLDITRESGCWSYVGKTGFSIGSQPLNLGPGCADVCKNNYILNSNNQSCTSFTPAMKLF